MKKVNLFIISGISGIMLFFILTFVETRIIAVEPLKKVFMVEEFIKKDEEILIEKIKEVEISADLVNGTDIITNKDELRNKYAVGNIYKGQILVKGNISTKEELKIVESVEGVERISINIKSPENAVSYQIKPGDRIHLYFTGRTSVVSDSFERYGLKLKSVQNDNSMQTVKLLEDVEILGVYDEFGVSINQETFNKPDTVILGVSKENAEIINNLRELGVFDITR